MAARDGPAWDRPTVPQWGSGWWRRSSRFWSSPGPWLSPPNDSAFHRAARDLSHGCVRVEKPLELAEWVLKGQSEWPREKIDAAMHAGTEKHVKLGQPIPVYLIYQTAWVDEAGRLQFLDDLYGHDAAQLRLLNDGPA